MEPLFNSIQIVNDGPRRFLNCAFVYVDGKEEEAQRYFKKHGVKVKPFKVFKMNYDDRYTLVGCEVRNSDVEAFGAALRDLQRDMLILGYRDYEEFCRIAFIALGLMNE